MKKIQWLPLLAIMLSLSSCDLIAGIFKAGMWTGVIMIVVVVALILFILSKVFGGK